jgi:hypothetical protein
MVRAYHALAGIMRQLCGTLLMSDTADSVATGIDAQIGRSVRGILAPVA